MEVARVAGVESETSEKSEKSGKTECRTGVQNEVLRCPK